MPASVSRASGAGPLAGAPSGVLVVGAIASVQFGSALAATLFRQLSPGGTVFLRLASAAIILLVLWRPRLRGRTREQLLLAGGFGLVLAGMNLSFYEAIDRIPLGVAVAIEFVGPLAVAVAGSRRRLDLLWVALAAAGILALTHGTAHGVDAVGVALALIAGGLWGTYIVLNARLGRVFEGSTGLTLALCVGALAALPIGIADAGSQLLDPELLALGAAVGVLSSVIPYSCEVEALRRIAPPVFGVLMSLEPAVAALAGFFVLGQALGARALLGIVLVVIASVGASRGSVDAAVSV
ncbi:MAG TPA: EamA family transporter [Solirubrobacteraceae bacterium]|jgi:inner membrane transporter RhtA|nr:EamA family transporter [Solirubrobacteraceae bacterium]